MYEPGGLNNVGCGQHGGTGRYEQSPFLIAWGGGFPTATVRDDPSSCIDVAPTLLRHLRQPLTGMDGRALQDA
jgi:arylsulfatase A-like enzyme